ncbi:hypothetical protein KO02_08350 [Sphingobacterium sp. ML3W]|uniref:hypothetical protein n=1 Tax=Sphingobacterium sp. ML3W TaxID=1538644 RepID=UPI0004F86AE1|nr:hypothetical protein [Sphingobacterium sp. ML3W]AIM36712.1 hypothetical protein KO02_08350 [Sphingobacterium sp. ML3W]
MGNKKEKIVEVSRFDKYAEINEVYSSLDRTYQINVPSNFRMLCTILDVKVDDILKDFMWLVSYSVHSNTTNKRRKAARKFFMSCRYGQPGYSEEQINQMFDELKAERLNYDTIDGMEREDLELFWRNNHMYKQHWFKRWFNKKCRKEAITVLNDY